VIDYLVLSLNLLYLVIALLQYFAAPKVGPNPYFGFRIGHTFANEKVWRDANKFMGKIMTVHAIILLPSCLIPDFLGYFLLLWIVPMLLFIPIGIRYASTRLEMEGARAKISSSKEIKPIELGFLWKISPVVLYIILLAYMIFTYPSPTLVILFISTLNLSPTFTLFAKAIKESCARPNINVCFVMFLCVVDNR